MYRVRASVRLNEKVVERSAKESPRRIPEVKHQRDECEIESWVRES